MTREYNGPNSPKWKKNSGRWSDPKLQLEAARKGGAVSAKKRKAQKAARKLLEDKAEFILASAAAATADNPEWMSDMIKMFMDIMNNPEADTRDRMNAADKLTDILGTRAPKATHVEVEDKSTIEDTTSELEKLGVSIKGLNVIEGGKK